MKKIILFMICFSFLFTACATSSAKEYENNITIVASFYPVYILAKNITDGVEGVTVENMAQPQTGCLHDYQLTTKDRKAIEQADLFLINGAGMESFLNGVRRQYTQLPIVDTSEGIHLLHSHHDHHHHSAEENHQEFQNGHIWLSSENGLKQAENICNALIQKDAAHAQQYQKNLEVFRSKIKAFESTEPTPSHPPKKVIIFHEGFDYIAEEYGFIVEGEILAEENQTPSAKELAQIIDHAKQEQIHLFFVADDAGRAYAEIIAKEVGGTVYLLNPITSGTLEKEAYLQALQQNQTIIQEALKQ